MTNVYVTVGVNVNEIAGELAHQLSHTQLIYLIERIDSDVGDWGFTRKLTEHFITEMCKLRVGESDEFDSFVKTVTELLKIDEDGK